MPNNFKKANLSNIYTIRMHSLSKMISLVSFALINLDLRDYIKAALTPRERISPLTNSKGNHEKAQMGSKSHQFSLP